MASTAGFSGSVYKRTVPTGKTYAKDSFWAPTANWKGVCIAGGTAGEEIAVQTTGGYTLPKDDKSQAFTLDQVVWSGDTKTGVRNATHTGFAIRVGTALEASAANEETVYVDLFKGKMPA